MTLPADDFLRAEANGNAIALGGHEIDGAALLAHFARDELADAGDGRSRACSCRSARADARAGAVASHEPDAEPEPDALLQPDVEPDPAAVPDELPAPLEPFVPLALPAIPSHPSIIPSSAPASCARNRSIVLSIVFASTPRSAMACAALCSDVSIFFRTSSAASVPVTSCPESAFADGRRDTLNPDTLCGRARRRRYRRDPRAPSPARTGRRDPGAIRGVFRNPALPPAWLAPLEVRQKPLSMVCMTVPTARGHDTS